MTLAGQLVRTTRVVSVSRRPYPSLTPLNRYTATFTGSKHRVIIWLEGSIQPDLQFAAIAETARALVEARDRWFNPPDLVEWVPEVAPGFPDRLLPRSEAAAKALKGRTLTNLYNTRGTPEGAWLDALHRRLDEAVAAAYG